MQSGSVQFEVEAIHEVADSMKGDQTEDTSVLVGLSAHLC